MRQCTKNISYPTGHSEESSIKMFHETCVLTSVVVQWLCLLTEGLGAAGVTGVGSNLTQPSGISYFSLYTFFSKELAIVMILGRSYIYIYLVEDNYW